MMKRPQPTSVWNKGRKRTEVKKKRNLSEKTERQGKSYTEEHKKNYMSCMGARSSLTAKLTEQQVIEIRLRF